MNADKYKLFFQVIPSDTEIALRQYKKAGQLKRVSGGYTLASGCPFHGGKEAGSFFIYSDGHFHCFSCGAHGCCIDFISNLYGISTCEAAELIAEEEGLISDGKIRNCKPVAVKPAPVCKKEKDLNYPLMDSFYSYLKEWFGLSITDEELLRKERGLSLARIRKDYFTMCANGRDFNNLFTGFKKLYPEYTDEDLSGIPGVYIRNNVLNLVLYEGIGILIRNARGLVTGVQCRRKLTQKGQTKKYIWLSSAFALDCKDCTGGASANSPQDVIYPLQKKTRYNICITEGKFKAEVLAQKGNIAISVQGVGNYKNKNCIDREIRVILEKYDVSTIYIFYDADCWENKGVMKQLKKLCQYLNETVPELAVKVATWDKKEGKGIDDLYFSHHNEKLSSYITYNDSSMFDEPEK